MRKILAIIPARAGSKRVKNKNIRDFHGKPLIQWTIDAAVQSESITEICVTTDETQILSLKDQYESKVKFLKRPEELASDTASSLDVILHAMKSYEEKFDAIILLQPTSPLRQAEHIEQAFEQFSKNKDQFLVSVRHPKEMMSHIVKKDLKGLSLLPSEAQYFTLNGAIYIAQWDNFLTHKGFFHPQTDLFLMSDEFSADIDTESDWAQAEKDFLSLKKY